MTGPLGLRKRRTPNGGPAFFTPPRRAGNEVQQTGKQCPVVHTGPFFQFFRCRSKLKNLLVGGPPPIPRTSALRAPVETPLRRLAARPADASQNHTARRHRWACSSLFRLGRCGGKQPVHVGLGRQNLLHILLGLDVLRIVFFLPGQQFGVLRLQGLDGGGSFFRPNSSKAALAAL